MNCWRHSRRRRARRDQPAPLVLVLDGVQDPHNLGACLRTADACGALAVVVPQDRAVTAERDGAQGGRRSGGDDAGGRRHQPGARPCSLLKEAGLWIVGADAEAPKLAHETDLAGPIALVLGAEGTGLRQLTRQTCDFLVRLPQQGAVESLNVSVAAGMLLYEAVRQRGVVGRRRGSACRSWGRFLVCYAPLRTQAPSLFAPVLVLLATPRDLAAGG